MPSSEPQEKPLKKIRILRTGSITFTLAGGLCKLIASQWICLVFYMLMINTTCVTRLEQMELKQLSEPWHLKEHLALMVPQGFYKAYRAIVKQDIWNVLSTFSRTGTMPQAWKDTFIVLIPKRSNPTMPSHHWPISLCITIYELINKVLTFKLKDCSR